MKTSKERTQSILQKAEAKRKTRKKIKIISILSSVAAALLAFNLVLFVPYTVGGVDISKYKSSQYYGVIQKLYGLTYSPHKTNNFNEWFGDMFKAGGDMKNDGAGAAPPTAPTAPGDSADDNGYRETTLNQTDGVTEGDLFKRSDTHIFYLGFTYVSRDEIMDCTGGDVTIINGSAALNLHVYSINGEQSKQVTEYTVMPDEGMPFRYVGWREMYLSEDLTTVTIITPSYDYATDTDYTVVINLDVSDLSHVNETNRTYISGSCVSSRVADGNLLVITDFEVRDNVNFGNVAEYVPQVGRLGELKPLLAEDIVCPNGPDSARYTVISSLDGNLHTIDSVALLSFSDDVYVSENNLFATRQYEKRVKTNNEYKLNYSYYESEIRIVPYDNGEFGKTRAVTAAGTVLNRYSLDEYEGVLRAVTTIWFTETSYQFTDKNNDPYNDGPYNTVFKNRCMLYCYDLDTLEVVGKVVDFAPAGESVRSARFDGDTAYVCTAEVRVVNTDPVYAFDLSDYGNITYTDTGTIPGYSLSLNKFAFNSLLGIGYGDTRQTLKIELYEQTDSAVTSVAKYEEDNVVFSSEFKAHLIDAQNGIIGLGIRTGYPEYGTRYAIFLYDGYKLTEIASVEMSSIRLDDMRAVIIDSYAYIFEEGGNDNIDGFKVVKIN